MGFGVSVSAHVVSYISVLVVDFNRRRPRRYVPAEGGKIPPVRLPILMYPTLSWFLRSQDILPTINSSILLIKFHLEEPFSEGI